MSKQLKTYLYIAAGIMAAILLAVGVLYASGKPSAEPQHQAENTARGFELLEYIPSDAVSLVCCSNLAAGLQRVLDASSPFRDLQTDGFENRDMVLSQHFVGDLIPLLAIDAGRESAKQQAALQELVASAARLGLAFRYCPSAVRGGVNVLLLSPSENIISSAVRHIEEHTSVLEAPGLASALTRAPSRGDVCILRNSALDVLLGKKFLSAYLPKQGSMQFLKRFCSWTVLSLESAYPIGAGEMLSFGLATYQPQDDMRFYMNALQAFPAGESRLSDILPYGTTFAVDMPCSSFGEFLAVRKKYLDAATVLDSYIRNKQFLTKANGHNPEHWAEELDIKEAAVINCQGEQLLFVRPAVKQPEHRAQPFECPGALGLLYGSVFNIKDESCCASTGAWLVIGSEQAVNHFLASRYKRKLLDWPTKNVKCAVLADDYQLSFTTKGASFKAYRKY